MYIITFFLIEQYGCVIHVIDVIGVIALSCYRVIMR